MVVLNNKNYNNSLIEVSFGKYNVTQNGKKRTGESLFVLFKIDNFYLGLETTYDKKWLKELKIDDKKNITEYISDITYEDEKGWLSLILGKYKCFINKVEENNFIIELNSDTEECGEHFHILLNEKVKIDF